MSEFPKFYVIDGDIFVMLYQTKNGVRGVNHHGMPYEPFMAVYNGAEITKEEFSKGLLEQG